ncbi:MAG: prolyl oligopeptidase family serine peptidase [Flavobacteriaceae bacterium]|jgi:hypothetical protein|nr:prolyl oligopeptidase family serine peptidase [Flavobacteriaceae bacterium]
MAINTCKYLISWLVMTISITASAQIDRDSLSINPNWSISTPVAISPNGKWSLITEIFPNIPSQSNKYLVHTLTKRKIKLNKAEQITFLQKDLYLSKEKERLSIRNLNDSTVNNSIDDVKYNYLHLDKGKISIVSTTNTYTVYNYLHLNKKVTKTLENIKKVYPTNNSSYQLIVQEQNKVFTLIQVDLAKDTFQKVLTTQKNIESVKYNFNQSKLLVNYIDRSFDVVELENFKKLYSSTTQNALELATNYTVSFALEDMLLITYSTPKSKKKESDYVDIWSSNTLDIAPYKGDNFTYTNQLIDYTKNKTILLDSKKEYFHLYHPKVLLSKILIPEVNYNTLHDTYSYYIENKQLLNHPILLTKTNEKLESQLNFSQDLSFLIYPDNKQSIILELSSLFKYDSLKRNSQSFNLWVKDSKKIIYKSDTELLLYDLSAKKRKTLKKVDSTEKLSFLHRENTNFSQLLDISVPQVFISNDSTYNRTRYIGLINNNTFLELYKQKDNKIDHVISTNASIKPIILFSEQNYNLPTSVVTLQEKKLKTIYENTTPKELYNNRKQEIISFTDKYQKDLKAVVYYPENYDPTKKYPLIVRVYEILNQGHNVFDIPLHCPGDGFNISTLTNKGYFVALVDTYVSTQGAGKTALNCVENAVAKITQTIKSVDKQKLGITGHSFGSYKVNYIITHSNLFQAAVSGAGVFDIVWQTYEYNYNFKRPSYFRTEGNQLFMEKSIAEDPIKYIDNNPAMSVNHLQTPVLLWTGMQDYNVHWEQTRHFYIALKKYNKPVVALFYKNVGHSIVLQPKEDQDLHYRTLSWFDYHLKGDNSLTWIKEALE